tara:strand:- start:496 stop:645 length:150 start_codon:yes stop_codon:yes gene_type:complete
MEIFGYILIGVAALGLCSQFFAIFCLEANDRLNEEYLNELKAKTVKYGP